MTDVLQGEEASLAMVSPSSNVDASVKNATSSGDAGGATTTVGTAIATLTQDVAMNGTIVVTVLATYGALADGLLSEDVTADSLRSVTRGTTITTIAVSLERLGRHELHEPRLTEPAGRGVFLRRVRCDGETNIPSMC